MQRSGTPATIDAAASLPGALALGMAMALAGSILELVALAYLKLVEGRFLSIAREAVWWIPLTLTAGSVVLVTAAWLGGGRFRALRRTSTLAGIAATWALLSPLLEFQPRLHPAALFLIAVGAGIQIGRLVAAHSSGAQRATGKALAILSATVVVLGLGLTRLERRSRLDPTTPRVSPPQGAWNVLIVMLDTVRAIDLSLYGYGSPTTPSLEALANSSVVFDQAIAPAPWTLPSHGVVFTGRWPSRLTVDWRSAEPSTTTTLAEVFRASGYRTAGFSANVEMLTYESGLAQGFETFQDRLVAPVELLRTPAVGRLVLQSHRFRNLVGPDWEPGRKTGVQVRRAFLGWLDREPVDRPFFAFLNFFDAHRPYDPPDAYRGSLAPAPRRPGLKTRIRTALTGPSRAGHDSASIREMHARYTESITAIDHEIGVIIDQLTARRQLDHTIIVVTADHGELFGEHGVTAHGNSLYANVLRVPLLIRAPGMVPTGRRVVRPISLRDLPRTVLEIAALEGREIEGVSLLKLWGGDSSVVLSPAISMVSQVPDARAGLPISRGDMASIIQDSLHYILNGDQSVELYDSRHDPYEQTPLETVVSPDELARLRRALHTVWAGDASLAPPLGGSSWADQAAGLDPKWVRGSQARMAVASATRRATPKGRPGPPPLGRSAARLRSTP